MRREREQKEQGCLCNSSHRYLKEDNPIQNVYLPMMKLTIKPQMRSKSLSPIGDSLKWQRLKVRDPRGGRIGRLPPCGCPYLGLTPSLSPQSQPAKWREGRKRGMDWMSSFQFEVLHLSLSSFPLAPLDGQALTKSLKSPREDEQCYAAQVRTGKGSGAWLQVGVGGAEE